ncbi:pilus assembly protein TadG-related protein [Agromyces bauzanensis]|uniref:Putative Flp pilus-assembly TadG-like N-terminal domain-containing protein n=1 Tax=Agromyces bauzanensis TaxID=1308924 RepID=A0A917PPH4_9MICO|nr:TadE/TadG family type IV pilus assembly protein [Agromyces bauzanensis]GGJ85999.1 hypothetical protein GCM10011372_25420 [Agromyces bauzanensis]
MSSERGASAVIVALLAIPLLGGTAIAVDVGALYAEKAQLQNGADGAALAIAKECAVSEFSCTAQAAATADGFANLNSNDDVSNNTFALDINDNIVTVTTTTNDASNEGGGLRHPFAAAVGFTEASVVVASATAEWGVPLGADTLPLAFPLCKFDDFMPSGPEGIGEEIWIRNDVDARKASDCEDSTFPSFFGWLTSGDCTADVTLTAIEPPEAWVVADPGKSPLGAGCLEARFIELQQSATPILIPVYDSIGEKGTAVDGQFHLVGFASFIITGWEFPSWSASPPENCKKETGAPSCSGIRGYFTDWVSVEDVLGGLGGDPSLPGLPVVAKLTY